MKSVAKDLWNNFELYVANIALALMVFMLALQAVARYILQVGIPWTEELSRFSFIFFVYITASLAVMRGTHIRVTILTDHLPAGVKKVVDFVGNILQIVFFLTAAGAGMSLVSDMVEYPTFSTSLLLPLYYIYFIIPFSYFMMAVRLIQRMVCKAK